MKDSCTNLEQQHRVALVTPVFQGDDPDVGPGACQGLASSWIRAIYTNNLPAFRDFIAQTPGKIDEMFIVAQAAGESKISRLKLEEAAMQRTAEDLKRALKGVDEVKNTTTLRPGSSARFRARETSTPEVENRLLKARMDGVELLRKDFRWHLSGGCFYFNEYTEKSIHDLASTACSLPKGLHLVTLLSGTGNHTVAFCIGPTSPSFFDANTGEWELVSTTKMQKFLLDYFYCFYKGRYNVFRIYSTG